MTDIVTDIRRNLAGPEHHPLMYSPPLRTAQVQELLAVIDALADDKRSLMRIVDDLSAQNTALNQMLQGVVEAAEWDRELTTPITAEVMADMKHTIANWGKRTAVGADSTVALPVDWEPPA